MPSLEAEAVRNLIPDTSLLISLTQAQFAGTYGCVDPDICGARRSCTIVRPFFWPLGSRQKED